MLIFNAPKPNTGLGWSLHLGVLESEPHTAVYYRFGGLIDQGSEVISQLSIDDAHKLIYGVLVELLGSWHITQHLDGKPCSISNLGLPGIIEDPVVFQHELIVVVHQKENLRTLTLFLPISYFRESLQTSCQSITAIDIAIRISEELTDRTRLIEHSCRRNLKVHQKRNYRLHHSED